jgi:hypothetical protein
VPNSGFGASTDPNGLDASAPPNDFNASPDPNNASGTGDAGEVDTEVGWPNVNGAASAAPPFVPNDGVLNNNGGGSIFEGPNVVVGDVLGSAGLVKENEGAAGGGPAAGSATLG